MSLRLTNDNENSLTSCGRCPHRATTGTAGTPARTIRAILEGGMRYV